MAFEFRPALSQGQVSLQTPPCQPTRQGPADLAPFYGSTAARASRVRRLTSKSITILVGLFFAAHAFSASLPAGFKETRLLSAINPTTMDIAPDGRVFWCQKDGELRIVKNDKPLAKPFVKLAVDIFQERGLLGVTLAPGFPADPFVYVYYTAKGPSHNRVSRFRADGDTAIGAEQILIELNNLSGVGYHNGGGIRFGKEGKLYIAAGNNANDGYSQSLTSLLGKLLRINADGSIPADNPFYDKTTGSNRAIWALGLRNPFTSAVQPGTGRILINEVGESSWEEIDEAIAGANYGWPKAEGKPTTAPSGLTGAYANPIHTYGHLGNCGITGGAFYNPGNPKSNGFGDGYLGLFFFGDYCGGWIKSIDPSSPAEARSFATGILRPLDVKVGPDGGLYYLARGNRVAGAGQGSEKDNTSTEDGSLTKVTGPVPVTVLLPHGRYPGSGLRMVSSAAPGRATLPRGKSSLALYDVTGTRVWEFRRGAEAGDIEVVLPVMGQAGPLFLTVAGSK